MAEKAQTQVKPSVVSTLTEGISLQRKCACGTHTLGDQCDSCKGGAGLLQRKVSGRGGYSEVPPIVQEVLRSPGQPLDAETRAFFEPRFGHDFSHVRVHTDVHAATSARSVNALAFTFGQHIVFSVGEYAPQTDAGRRLLSHELTHVVQQRRGVHLGRAISQADDNYERHANEVAQALAGGRSVSNLLSPFELSRAALPSGSAVQRQINVTERTAKQTESESELSDTSSDPFVLAAAVGVGGVNRVDDVAKVQARLLALGLLSEEDFGVESPQAVTVLDEATHLAAADSMALSTVTSTVPSDSLRATMPVDSLGANVSTTDPNVAANTSANEFTTDVTVQTVPESSLTATIIAIREFQQTLFAKEIVDGNIGALGPTWRALSTAGASFAKLKQNWESKKQQIKEEQARKKAESARLKEEAASKLMEDAGRKKIEAERKIQETERRSTATAKKLLAVYATYIPLTSTYINLDESGLARVLAISATFDALLVSRVFEALDENDAEEVASEMVRNASEGELATFALSVLLHLKLTIRFGEQTAETPELLNRINSAIQLKGRMALPPS